MSNKPLASQYDASQRCARLHGHSRPEYRGYCFFSGAAGVTGCEPPVDFGPVVTSALLSVEPLESLAAVVLVFGLAPLVGPLPASFVDVVPLLDRCPRRLSATQRPGQSENF